MKWPDEWYTSKTSGEMLGYSSNINGYGGQQWFRPNETLHRDDGPARIYNKGKTKQWYLEGNLILTSEEYQRVAELTNEQLFAVIIEHGSIEGSN